MVLDRRRMVKSSLVSKVAYIYYQKSLIWEHLQIVSGYLLLWLPKIKCLYSIDGSLVITLTPNEITEKYGNNFFMHKGGDGLLHLPHNNSYYAQVQGELAIMNVEWCDFIAYSSGEVDVDRIVADYDYWTEVNDKLDIFYMWFVVPETLSGAIFMKVYAHT